MKPKTLIIAANLAILLIDQAQGKTTAQGNKDRVVKCHPEAFVQKAHDVDYGYGWQVWVEVKHIGAKRWEVIGFDQTNQDTAWFTALEWCIAYDCCK